MCCHCLSCDDECISEILIKIIILILFCVIVSYISSTNAKDLMIPGSQMYEMRFFLVLHVSKLNIFGFRTVDWTKDVNLCQLYLSISLINSHTLAICLVSETFPHNLHPLNYLTKEWSHFISEIMGTL